MKLYPHPRISDPLLIRNAARGYYSPGADWIAFNPVIARNLGWSLATDGMFKWVDSGSLTMVESYLVGRWFDSFYGV